MLAAAVVLSATSNATARSVLSPVRVVMHQAHMVPSVIHSPMPQTTSTGEVQRFPGPSASTVGRISS